MFERDAFKIEKFIKKRLPIFAKATKEAKVHDEKLAKYFSDNEYRKFDGVLYYPRTEDVYCSFYDETDKVAVLVSIFDLKFQNSEIQKRVNKFQNKYNLT